MTSDPFAPKGISSATFDRPQTVADICSVIAALGWIVYGLATFGFGFLAAVAFAANLKSVLTAPWRLAAFVVQALAVVVAVAPALFMSLYAEAGAIPWWVPLLTVAAWAFVAISWSGSVAGWRRWSDRES